MGRCVAGLAAVEGRGRPWHVDGIPWRAGIPWHGRHAVAPCCAVLYSTPALPAHPATHVFDTPGLRVRVHEQCVQGANGQLSRERHAYAGCFQQHWRSGATAALAMAVWRNCRVSVGGLS